MKSLHLPDLITAVVTSPNCSDASCSIEVDKQQVMPKIASCTDKAFANKFVLGHADDYDIEEYSMSALVTSMAGALPWAAQAFGVSSYTEPLYCILVLRCTLHHCALPS